MSEHVAEISDSDFDSTIASGVVLVDFWAPWCGPCQMMGPVLDAVAQKAEGKAKVAKVNVDENQDAAGKFGIQSIPTMILFKDGAEAKRFVGVQSEGDLVAAIDENA